MTCDIRIIRATADDAPAVAGFLSSQDVRPAPREADVALFPARAGTALVYALHRGRIEGVAGCIKDGPFVRLAYFAVTPDAEHAVGQALLQELESSARGSGALALAAQATAESQVHRCLIARGYGAEWEEGDAQAGGVVTMIELVKLL